MVKEKKIVSNEEIKELTVIKLEDIDPIKFEVILLVFLINRV